MAAAKYVGAGRWVPGDQEDRAGEPFVGPAGKLLDRALADAGIDPESIFRTNVVRHFRWSGRRGRQRIHKSPARSHVTACRPWLEAYPVAQPPEWVVATTHPSAVLRTEDREAAYDALVADLRVAADLLR